MEVARLKQQAVDLVVYVIVRTLIAVVQTLPMETCVAFAQTIAWLANDVFRVRRRVVHENLARVFPQHTESQIDDLSREMWEHLLVMVCEIAHAPRKIHETNWRRYFAIPNVKTIVKYLLDNRPNVMVSGHYGNFELGGFVMGMLGFPNYTVARVLDNPYLNRFINRFRGHNGQFILPKQGSSPTVQHILGQGGALTILGDQFAGPKGCWVEFLGHPASCHKATALFTISTGAPLMVIYARRAGKPMQFEIGVSGVLDPAIPNDALANVKTVTEWYNRRLEEIVYQNPEQYWWLHRRWKDERAPKRKPVSSPGSAASGADRKEAA